jgi:hypothetical protein
VGWYQVVKTINGRRYLYWQKTYRVSGSVKTLNRYICPADSRRAVFAHAINKPDAIALREKWRDDKVYAYVKEWGEYEFTSEQDAAIYARNLEYGEGGGWHPFQLSSKFWRAHRCMDCGGWRDCGGAVTARDFVPWRFSAAGRSSAWIGHHPGG